MARSWYLDLNLVATARGKGSTLREIYYSKIQSWGKGKITGFFAFPDAYLESLKELEIRGERKKRNASPFLTDQKSMSTNKQKFNTMEKMQQIINTTSKD